jgi:hypothetical protein
MKNSNPPCHNIGNNLIRLLKRKNDVDHLKQKKSQHINAGLLSYKHSVNILRTTYHPFKISSILFNSSSVNFRLDKQ